MKPTLFDSVQPVIRHVSRILPALACLLTSLLTHEAGAATRYWLGTADNNWSTPANWTPVGPPQNGDTLIFTNNLSNNINNDLPGLTVNSLFFYNNFTVSGNTLTVTGEIANFASGGVALQFDTLLPEGNVTLNAVYSPLQLTCKINLDNFNLYADSYNGNNLDLAGVIFGTGNVICQQGIVSIDTLDGNTFNGLLQVWGGTNYLDSFYDPAAPGSLEVDSGATVITLQSFQLGGAVSIFPSGQLLFYNHTNTITSLTMQGGLIDSGPQGLINLMGQLTANATNATAVVNGNLTVRNDIYPVQVNGSWSPGLTINASVTGIDLTKSGFNSLDLTSSNSLYGDVDIQQGIVEVDNSYAFGTASVDLDGGALILRGVSIGNALFANRDDGLQPDGRLGTLMTCYNTSSWVGPVDLGTNLFVLNLGDMTFSGAISGPGGLSFFGGGTSRLTGSQANTFTGTLISEASLLELDKPSLVNACSGPMTVGGSGNGPLEVRWQNGHQDAFCNLTVYSNGLVNLNNNNEDFDYITFNGGTIETGTGEAALYELVTVNPTNSSAVINGNLDLPSGYTASFNVGAGTPVNGDDLIINAAINGTTSDFVKQGAGTMSLAGINSFQGTILLTEGILAMDNSGAFSIAPVVISAGATLKLDVNTSLSQTVELSGDGLNGTLGALDLAPNATVTLNGPMSLDAETTLNVAGGGVLQLSGVISGTGPLTEIGPGEIILAGGSANTYTGETDVNQGSMVATKPVNIAAIPGNVVVGTKSSPLNNNGTTAFLQGTTGSIGGTNVTVNGGSSYTIANGGIQSLASVNLVNGGSIATGSGTLKLTGGSGANVVNVSPGQGGASIISGNVYLSSGGNFSVGGRIQTGSSPELDLQAGLNDQIANGISKNGAGQMQLSAANSFSSAMTVNGGTLILPNSASLGNSTSTTVNNDSVLKLSDGISIQSNSLALNSSNSMALDSVSGSNVWTGSISLSQTGNLFIAGGYLNLLGPVSGPGGLILGGAGTLQFEGTNANTYAGLTTVSGGVLEAARFALSVHRTINGLVTNKVSQIVIPGDVAIGSDAASDAAAALQIDYLQPFPSTANVAVHSSGALNFIYLGTGQLQPGIDTIQTLTGSGQVNLVLNSSLTINNSSPFTFYGSINGAGDFSKFGSGTMTTWGDINNTGNVDLSGGDWELFGARHNGGIAVSGGARLAGDGIIDGQVTVSGASVAVDSHLPNQQGSTFEMGSLSNAAGATVQLDMFGTAPTGGNDRIVTTSGGVFLSSDTLLSTSFSYPPHQGDVIDLISPASGQTITNAFANFADGVATIIDQIPVVPSYHGGAGHDFTLTVTNLALAYVGYQLAEGNGNQTVEPNECNLLYVTLVNQRTNSLTITNAYLRATNATGVVVTIPVAEYPVIAAGQTAANMTPFQFSTDTNLPCGGAVGFELVLGVVNEGQFAIDFSPVSGTDCSHPTGPCDSCTVATGRFTTNTPATTQPLYFVGAASIAYPPKAYPGTNPAPLLSVTPYLTHSFTNSTTNLVCVTAALEFDCSVAPTNALGVAAYLGIFDPNNPSAGYLGDIGQGGPPYPAFAFQVPADTNFTLVVMAQATNLPCSDYALQLFGLPCPPPVLAIQPEPTATNQVRVNWSTAYPGFTAQQSGQLNGGTFSNVIQSPVILNSRYALTNLPVVTNQFYRLKQ